jgi:hypothetical protein
MKRRLFTQSLLAAPLLNLHAAEGGLRIATFEVDVTPPLESPLCHGNVMPVKQIVTPLLARGLVILGSGQPIVLCAMDWVALANASNVIIRETIAKAVGTTSERVAVHTVHQHDAPGSDLDTEQLLAEHGLGGRFSNAAARPAPVSGHRRCGARLHERRRRTSRRSALVRERSRRSPPTAACSARMERWPSLA